jgi:hypothetical protein
MRNATLFVTANLAAFWLALTVDRDASACGGCFHPPPPPTETASDITDERMLLSVSPTQTTLYDQIRYTGAPSSFAWVLPIHGTVTVGLSADVLFDSVDALTATEIVAPPRNCAPPPSCSGGGSGSGGGELGGTPPSAPPGKTTVTKQQNVGPYETVQLHATDSSALENWLAQNGFIVPAAEAPVIAEYVAEGFDFLAMKLLPDQGVQAMRPVRVTAPGASLSLPLRMAAIGTGVTVGITIWVVSDGRYEPQNFPFFHIDDSQLVWDWSTSSSNYTQIRAQNEAAQNGKGWEIESSIALNEALVQGVIESGGAYYPPSPPVSGSGSGSGSGGPGLALPPTDASGDYLPVTADGGVDETAEQVRADDITALFAGMTGPTVRVTRVRSDISHAAMTADLVFQASADQAELSNVREVSQSVNLVCPTYSSCPSGGSTGGGVNGGASSSGSTGASGSSSGGTTAWRGNGCEASAQTSGNSALSLGALAALFGVVVARARKSRRK